MSYSHPLRQTQTVDYTSPKREPSNASTISSAYSHSSGAFELSRTSTLSSTASSGYAVHKRGKSEATGMSPTFDKFSGRSSHEIHRMEAHIRVSGSHFDLFPNHRMLPRLPETSANLTLAKSNMDVGTLSLKDLSMEENTRMPPLRASMVRPNSMVLNRADSTSRGSRSQILSHPHGAFIAPDLQALQRSTTSQLRNLSKFAEDVTAENYTIVSREQKSQASMDGGNCRKALWFKMGGIRPQQVEVTTDLVVETGWTSRDNFCKHTNTCVILVRPSSGLKTYCRGIFHIVQLEEALRMA